MNRIILAIYYVLIKFCNIILVAAEGECHLLSK